MYGGNSSTFKQFKCKQQSKRSKSMTLQRELTSDEAAEMFAPWECVSLVRDDFTTLDFMIKDHKALYAFVHVCYANVL